MPLHPIPEGKKLRLVVEPGPQTLSGCVMAQPSKNYTTRYLLAAALAPGTSIVRNVATSEDSHMMQKCLLQMGVGITRAENGDLHIKGVGGHPVQPAEPINPGNAGAVLRFLLGTAALLPEAQFVTDRQDSLGKRPNADLLDALEQIGCKVRSRNGCLPISIRGGKLRGGTIRVNGENSSQFVSSLLFLAPLVGEPVGIHVIGRLVSRAPVRQTLEVMRKSGIEIDVDPSLTRFSVRPQSYQSGTYQVNGDWPGSAALLAAATATRSDVVVQGLYDDEQGERHAAQALSEMGAFIEQRETAGAREVHVKAGDLNGIDFDGDLATDAVLALMGAACFAKGRTRFHNVRNLRIKECDRISEPIAELRKIGVQCWEGHETGDPDRDAIVIDGNPAGYDGGITVNGRRDHRVIMLETIVGLGCRQGLVITEAEHVAKSYPEFFAHMTALGAKLHLEAEE